MEQISVYKFEQLRTIAKNTYNHPLAYSSACNLWSMVLYYTKLQNNFIQDNEAYEIVRSFQLFDEKTETVTGFNVRACSNYNRLQWFKLLLGSSLSIYSRQQIKEILI